MTSKISVKTSYVHSKSDPQTRHTKKLISAEKKFALPSEPSMESIEEEMARVFGEEVGSPVQLKDSTSSKPHLSTATLRVDSCKTMKCASEGVKQKSDFKNVEQCNKETSVTDWHLLRLKNESDFHRKMKRLEEEGGAKKRARLEKRFLELFGPDETTGTASSPNGNISERKDKDVVAALTVKHLMPLYKQQKIASKDLFKKLAKHISNKLMEKLSAPDENDVKSIVQEYFQNGKCVNSDADIH